MHVDVVRFFRVETLRTFKYSHCLDSSNISVSPEEKKKRASIINSVEGTADIPLYRLLSAEMIDHWNL